MKKDSYDIIAEEVKKFWKSSFPQEVIAFFQQKYEFENDEEWEDHSELVECEGSDCYDTTIFLNDFCEGQTCVKNIKIVPLDEILEFYKINKLGKE